MVYIPVDKRGIKLSSSSAVRVQGGHNEGSHQTEL